MPSNVVRLPRRRRRKAGLQLEAEIIEFPDMLEITPPPFDPAKPHHLRMWHRIWYITVLEIARYAPAGHPLGAWYEAELRKTFPPVAKNEKR